MAHLPRPRVTFFVQETRECGCSCCVSLLRARCTIFVEINAVMWSGCESRVRGISEAKAPLRLHTPLTLNSAFIFRTSSNFQSPLSVVYIYIYCIDFFVDCGICPDIFSVWRQCFILYWDLCLSKLAERLRFPGCSNSVFIVFITHIQSNFRPISFLA